MFSGSKSGNQFFIEQFVHCIFTKNSDNSHFSTIRNSAGSGQNHNISLERCVLSLFQLVFLKQCLDMIRHSMTIFVFLKKFDFFEIQKLAKKQKIEDFTKNPCPNQRIVLLEETLL